MSYVSRGERYPPASMIIVHACTMITEHVSCPIGLMFDELEGGGSGGRSPPGKQGGLGGRRPPNGRRVKFIVSLKGMIIVSDGLTKVIDFRRRVFHFLRRVLIRKACLAQ